MVKVGFLSGLLTNGAASATNRFLASWAWQYLFRAEVAGSLPIRTVPSSWMISPPIEMPSPSTVGGPRSNDLSAHGFKDGLESIVHVLRLFDLMLGPLKVETQNGDTPAIHYIRVDVAVSLFIGDLLAAAGQMNVRAVALANRVLQIGAITLLAMALAVKRADSRDEKSSPDFDVIAARKIFLFLVPQPPGHIDMHASHAIAVMAREAVESGDMCVETIAHAVGKIAAHGSGSVGESIRDGGWIWS